MNLKIFLAKMDISIALEETILALANAIVETGNLIKIAPITKQLGKLNQENIQGETQSKLDVLSNDIFIRHLQPTQSVIGAVSEEMEDEIVFEKKRIENQQLVFFDPLDGSSNVEPNVSVGSIFSVYKVRHENAISKEDFLETGSNQLAAGFSVYGPSMILILTVGNGTYKFCYDESKKVFVCTDEKILIDDETNEFSINMSNQRFWTKAVQEYVADCQLGTTGARRKDFNMRYIASMVADLNRILTRGGIYLYPKDNKVPELAGRLRLMYEINPMAFIVEQCKGACTDGINRILDLKPENIHQRVPVVIGSKDEVELVRRYYHKHS
jgi:fructose-1,6-bisphosphatase